MNRQRRCFTQEFSAGVIKLVIEKGRPVGLVPTLAETESPLSFKATNSYYNRWRPSYNRLTPLMTFLASVTPFFSILTMIVWSL
jgi:hypothetical protein